MRMSQIKRQMDVENAHVYCDKNEAFVRRSTKCGCFYCGEIFPVSSYIEFINGTAICPVCGIDSVLPNCCVEISDEFLLKMHNRWF